MNLLDIIEVEEAKAKPPENCEHKYEEKTVTIWPGTTDERMTWTCRACGHVRGRC